MPPAYPLTRMAGIDFDTFKNDWVAPELHGNPATIYDIDRESTAKASIEKLSRARQQLPTGVLRMHGVGLKIDGRSSLYEMWWLNSGYYAVDINDRSFVARAGPPL